MSFSTKSWSDDLFDLDLPPFEAEKLDEEATVPPAFLPQEKKRPAFGRAGTAPASAFSEEAEVPEVEQKPIEEDGGSWWFMSNLCKFMMIWWWLMVIYGQNHAEDHPNTVPVLST